MESVFSELVLFGDFLVDGVRVDVDWDGGVVGTVKVGYVCGLGEDFGYRGYDGEGGGVVAGLC